MIKLSAAHIFSGLFIIFIQILLLKNIQIGVLDRYVLGIFAYPLIIITLPFSWSRSLITTIAFFLGLIVDVFYDTLGVHAAALVLTAFARGYIIRILEPRGGYGNDDAPNISKYGSSWFLGFVAILLFIHILAYYSFDAFTFVFFIKILFSTVLSFCASYVLIILYSIVVRL